MKALTIAIALGLTSGLFGTAQAESFNERGEDFIASVKPDPKIQRQLVGALVSGFNDRGHDESILPPVRSNKLMADVHNNVRGFNNRSHVSFY